MNRKSQIAIRKSFTLIELLVSITVISILTAVLMPALRSAKESGNGAKCLSNLRQLYLANCLYAENHSGAFVLAAEDIWGANLKRWHGERVAVGSPYDPAKSPLVSYLGKDGKIKMCPSFRNYTADSEAGSGGYGYNEVYIGGRGDLYDIGSDANSSTKSLSLNDPKAWNLSLVVMFADAAMPKKQAGADIITEYPFIEPPFWESPPGTILSAKPNPSVHFRHNGRAKVIWCDGHATSEEMSDTFSPNISYGGDNYLYKVGWFGPRQKNACWRPD